MRYNSDPPELSIPKYKYENGITENARLVE
jgi:hypothetical protein